MAATNFASVPADTATTPASAAVPDVVVDDAGHKWQPLVDDRFCDQAREFGVDLRQLVRGEAGPLFTAITGNQRTWVSLLWLAVEKQAEAQSVTPKMFAALCRGRDANVCAVLESLTAALFIAIARRFPGSRYGRNVLHTLHTRPEVLRTLFR